MVYLSVLLLVSMLRLSNTSREIEEERAYSGFIQRRGKLIFQDEFDTFDTKRWQVS